MGKQKRLVKEFEAALEVVLEDYHAERTKRIAAEFELSVMAGIANMFHRDVQRLTEERDAALEDVETLTEADAEASATIGELRKELAAVQAQHYAVSEALDLEREYSAKTIGALRAEVEQMRKDWSSDVSAARDDLIESLARANTLIGNIRFQRDGLRGRCAALSDELDALKAAQAAPAEPNDIASKRGVKP